MDQQIVQDVIYCRARIYAGLQPIESFRQMNLLYIVAIPDRHRPCYRLLTYSNRGIPKKSVTLPERAKPFLS
jgi:hypothetical protein